MLCIGKIKLPPGLPLLQKTRLGRVVSGGYGPSKVLTNKENNLDRLDDLLRRFCEVECRTEPIIRVFRKTYR